ncbi:reticulon-like protein B12 isoform X2 [Manihot esculenta]|uniref:reticulon-like protein B12 isoform X2 n=1 Tax=Manihot esculenta TaxID=3983 RepID=UPI000B5D74CF|nr:reticulon-like protein B12 isoform X2 [Manihot esculenta]
MGSSNHLFNRQRTVHEIFGGGFVADVILWRQKNVTVGILLVALASLVVFERWGYTLLSLVSSVLLLLLTILFLWAKSAAILNRPSPPLPELHLSEETVNEVAAFVRTRLNAFLSVSQDIALGKDTNSFFKVAGYLLLISILGLLIILTIPALYERYEDFIDKYVKAMCKKSQQLYAKFDVECIGTTQKWVLEKQKLG